MGRNRIGKGNLNVTEMYIDEKRILGIKRL